MGYPNSGLDNEMVLKYIPLVKRIAGKIQSSDVNMDKDDLFSVGVIGLIDAVKKFDAEKSVPFEAYATVRIKGTIIDEMRRTGKVSRDRIAKLNEYYSVKEKLEQQLMRSPDEQVICDELGITEKDLCKLHETVHDLSNVSLETMLFQKDGGEMQLSDFIKDESIDSPEEDYLKKERKQLLKKAIGILNDREQIILNLYYVEELTLKEIAYTMGISVPRVSQLHGKIILKLREQMA